MASQFQLPDGRSLDYNEFGAKHGFPLIYFHGTPGSYLPSPSLVTTCDKKGIKLVTFSRPGYGSSTRNKGRRIVDVVHDVHALNQHLGIERCIVGGVSGGGPHVLACAARLPGCVAVLSIAGVAPFDAEGLDFLAGQGEDNVLEYGAALKGEEELQKCCAVMRTDLLKATAVSLVEVWTTLLPPVDKEAFLQNTDLAQSTIDSFNEGLKINSDGWVDDDMAFISHWGFELDEIKVPVLLYQGSEDQMVPFAHGQWLAKHLPQDKLEDHLQQGQGHISIRVGQIDSMLDRLLEIANAKK